MEQKKGIEQINAWFREMGSRLMELRWAVFILLIILNVLAFVGVQRVQINMSRENWFLPNDPITIATNNFKTIFGNADSAAVLIEAGDVFAPEVLRVIREIGRELEEHVPYVDDIVSLTDLDFTRGTEEGVDIGNIVPDDIPTYSAEIEAIRTLAFSKEFLVNRLFSDDSRQAWIVVRLSEYPNDWQGTLDSPPQNLVGKAVLDVIMQEKYRAYTLKATGPPVFYSEIQQFYSRESGRLMQFAVLVAVVVLALSLRSVIGVIVPLFTAASSVLWVFGAMGHLGIKINSMIITIPIFLGMAVSIGYSIHLFNFFKRHFRETGKRKESVIFAIQETGWPIFFTALTTVGALLAFYFVPITLVRWMGLSAAAVVVTTYLIVMTLTPIALSFGKDRPIKTGENLHSGSQKPSWIDGLLEQSFAGFSHWIQGHSTPILIVFALIGLFMLGGITQISIDVSPKRTDGLKVPPVRKMYDIGNTKIGTINSYNITLTFQDSGMAKTPHVLNNLDRLGAEILEFPNVKRISSLLDVIKDMNQVMNANAPEFYRIPDDQELISQLLLLYEISDGTEQENWVDYEYTTLRLLVEVSDVETGEIVRQLNKIERRTADLFPEATFAMVGGLVQTSLAQDYVSRGEVVSFLIALVVISGLMILVFRSVKVGLIGMIPNMAPVLVVGGLMGYLNISLEMTTMMIIPMLLGLAVDDTIHFINHCHLEFKRCGSYAHSIDRTFQTVGKAIFMTSFILIATFLVYMSSVARFFINLSLLASSGVLAALLADYFITPVLVLKSEPYGKPTTLPQDEEPALFQPAGRDMT